MIINIIKEKILNIKNLVIYKKICKDEVIENLIKYCDSLDNENILYDFISILLEKAEKLSLEGDIFKKYIIYLLLNDENYFSIACENKISLRESSIYKFALNDMKIILSLINAPIDAYVGSKTNISVINYVPIKKCKQIIDLKLFLLDDEWKFLDYVVNFYKENGVGILSSYKMLKYKNNFIGIENYDKIVFEDIIGYENQKKELIENTNAFLKKMPANNTLLIGARGTGKSSCVKSLANMFFPKGLRLIEINKDELQIIPDLLNYLSRRGLFFIIFIDDLSYDETELNYKFLKTILEGSCETKPDNVLFYATSNRKHLIQEFFSDRSKIDDEIHGMDTMNEKLALKDRFGLTITFGKPTPKEYLDIVISLARKNNLNISDDELIKKAMAWELNQNVKSGRTAKQFVDYLQSRY